MFSQFTSSLALALESYRKRPTLNDISIGILYKGRDGLKRAEKLAFRFQGSIVFSPNPRELKQLTETIAPLFKKPKSQLTSEESIVLGLFCMVSVDRPIDFYPGPAEEWIKERWQIANSYFRHSVMIASDSYSQGFAYYWLAYLYNENAIPITFDDVKSTRDERKERKRKLEITFRNKARRRGINALLPFDSQELEASAIPHIAKESLRKAIKAQCPIALYECGRMLIKKNQPMATFWMSEALAQGYDKAAFSYAMKFENQDLETAILFFRANAEHFGSGRYHLHSILEKISSYSSFIRYHICFALLHTEDEENEHYKKALSVLMDLFNYSHAVDTLRKKIKEEDFAFDLNQCSPDISDKLRENWRKSSMRSVEFSDLQSAVSHEDLMMAHELMPQLVVTLEQKNLLGIRAKQRLFDLIRTNSKDINPDHSVNIILFLITEGAYIRSSKESKAEKKEVNTETLFLEFFEELVALDFSEIDNPKLTHALSRLFNEVNKFYTMHSNLNELYEIILSSIKLREKILSVSWYLEKNLSKIFDLFQNIAEAPLGTHFKIPKATQVFNLVRLSIENNFALSTLKTEHLNELSKKDRIQLIITLVQKKPKSHLPIMDVSVLLQLSHEVDVNADLLNSLLSASYVSQAFCIRYYTALGILSTYPPDHLYYKNASGSLIVLIQNYTKQLITERLATAITSADESSIALYIHEQICDEIQKYCGSEIFAMVKPFLEKKEKFLSVPPSEAATPKVASHIYTPCASPLRPRLFGGKTKDPIEMKIDPLSKYILPTHNAYQYYRQLDDRNDEHVKDVYVYICRQDKIDEKMIATTIQQKMQNRIDEADATYLIILNAIKVDNPLKVSKVLEKNHIFLRDLNFLIAYAKDKKSKIQTILENKLTMEVNAIMRLPKLPHSAPRPSEEYDPLPPKEPSKPRKYF